MSDTTHHHSDLLALTTDIVSAYVGHNSVASADLPTTISEVFNKLSVLGAAKEEAAVELTPAVPIKKSVSASLITCLDCGRKFKMLKRHLRTDHGMEPADYRTRWSLGYDYPMVAPDYSKTRKALAVKIGLGRKPSAPKQKRGKKA
jgi:predicted transcriptional regulator